MNNTSKMIINQLIVALFLFVIVITFIFCIHNWSLRIDNDKANKLEIFDGTTGSKAIIEGAEAEPIIDNLKDIKLKPNGIALFRLGYRFKVRILDESGTSACNWGLFYINGDNTIRNGLFFYTAESDFIDVEYIDSLVNEN